MVDEAAIGNTGHFGQEIHPFILGIVVGRKSKGFPHRFL